MIDIIKRNNVTISGNGLKTIVFAHGYGCDKHVWDDIKHAFADKYRLVLFDYVGAGGSELSAYNSARYSTLEGYALDIIEIYELLELKDTIFVGHSVSSIIGILAAIAKPELFERLILIGPSPRYINDTYYTGGFEQQDMEGLFSMMEKNYLGWSRALAPSIMGNGERPELGERLTNSFCATDPEIAKEFARVTFLSDNRNDLEKLTVPALIIQCTEDIIAPIEVGKYVHEKIKDSEFVIIEATGHCPHMSAPEEIIRVIEAYLTKNN